MLGNVPLGEEVNAFEKQILFPYRHRKYFDFIEVVTGRNNPALFFWCNLWVTNSDLHTQGLNKQGNK